MSEATSVAPAAARAARVALTLVLAAAAAWLCEAIGTPIPWMIGPLVATAAASVIGAPLDASRRLRDGGQWLIGTALGLFFTPAVVALVTSHVLSMAAGVVWALALGLGFNAFLRRVNGAPGERAPDAATTFFASAIGGASEMALLAERHGARVDLVAAAHTTRVLLVVILIPFGFQWAGLHGIDTAFAGAQTVQVPGLALLLVLTATGGALLRRSRWPNPWLLGPLAVAFGLTALGVQLSALPRALSNAAQLVIAVSLGTRFTPQFVRVAPRWLTSVALGTLVMIGACAAFAVLVAQASGLHPATLMLATSPGGMAEMCITAKVLQLGVPVVTAFHVTRLAAVLLVAEPLYRWTARRA
jgi:membrane AbrB-like protein